jgi:DmsE family decaheme c-type cytochrome
MKIKHFIPICGLCLVLIAAVYAQPASIQDTAEYIGNETCLECHDEMPLSLRKTPHLTASLSLGEMEIESCEACHGPGSVHLDDPEAEGSIRTFRNTPPAETTASCLSCHQQGRMLKEFLKQKHYQTGMDCLDCHAIHEEYPHRKLLSEVPQELCLSCHQDQVGQFNLPFHHKVQEGRMTCWSCHEPHNTEVQPQSMGYKRILENCFECHPSQRGPFTYEHLAANVARCQACHNPHGSENARLLKRSTQSFLCIECHSGSSPQDGLFGKKTPSWHITTRTTYQNCTICHVKIHGSYLSRFFLR